MTYVTLRRHMQIVVILHVTVPVVQRGAADGDPHESADKVHQSVGQLAACARRNHIKLIIKH